MRIEGSTFNENLLMFR